MHVLWTFREISGGDRQQVSDRGVWVGGEDDVTRIFLIINLCLGCGRSRKIGINVYIEKKMINKIMEERESPLVAIPSVISSVAGV